MSIHGTGGLGGVSEVPEIESQPEVTAGEVPSVAADDATARLASTDGRVPDAHAHQLEAGLLGPEAPPTSEVSALLEQYGIKGRLGRPRERVARWAAEIQTGLEGYASTDERIDGVLDADLRQQVFKLQGLLKLYRKHPEVGDAIEPHYRAVKALEDQIGAYAGARSIAADAHEQGLPEAAVEHLEAAAAKERGALAELLESQWTPMGEIHQISALDGLLTDIAALDWPGYEDDKAHVRGQVDRVLRKLDTKSFDMDELQGDEGLHELRRQLRWFTLYAMSTDGMFQLSEPVTDADGEVYAKYAALPSSDRESDPIVLPKELFLENTAFIAELGEMKDRGERVEAFEAALHESGAVGSKKKAHKKAERFLGIDKRAAEALEAQAESIYERFSESDLVDGLREAVRG